MFDGSDGWLTRRKEAYNEQEDTFKDALKKSAALQEQATHPPKADTSSAKDDDDDGDSDGAASSSPKPVRLPARTGFF